MKKKFPISTIILLIILVVCIFYRTEIVTFVMQNIVQYSEVEEPSRNEYSTDYDFELVKLTDNFHVTSKDDILDVIYTVLNSGTTSFTFYCDKDYDECQNDLENVSEDQTLLSVINNMVSPYNSYEMLYMTINTYGKAVIEYDKLYSDEEIEKINSKIDEIENEVINDGMSDREKIKAFHDYVINNSVYDEERASLIESGDSETHTYSSHKATGPLLEGYALCSGYSDAMKIYLDRLGVKNYKIATDNHIWNLVYLDDSWLHIDLTWDDPVTSDHSNMLLDKFFLIDTDTLLSLDTSNHSFNSEYYLELK